MANIQKHSNGQQEISPASRQALASCLAVAGELYRTEITEPTVRTWAALMAPYSPSQIKQAFTAHFQQSKFFPSPAEIIDLIPEPEQPRSEWKGFDPQMVKAIEEYENTPEAEEQRKQWKELVRKIAGRSA